MSLIMSIKIIANELSERVERFLGWEIVNSARDDCKISVLTETGQRKTVFQITYWSMQQAVAMTFEFEKNGVERCKMKNEVTATDFFRENSFRVNFGHEMMFVISALSTFDWLLPLMSSGGRSRKSLTTAWDLKKPTTRASGNQCLWERLTEHSKRWTSRIRSIFRCNAD